MSFRMDLGLGLFALTSLGVLATSSVEAATANCMSPEGMCEISNDAGDFIECECIGGDAGAGDGGNEWDGLTEEELEPICDEVLDGFCAGGAPPEPEGVFCEGMTGFCVVDNEPEDSASCECVDGSGGGFVGGMDWAGLTDEELEEVCLEQVNSFCEFAEPPPPGVFCEGPQGFCEINNVPEDSLYCECNGGFGGGVVGGMDWAGLSDEELHEVCLAELPNFCGGGMGGGIPCGTESGSCVISNDPFDSINCECAAGDGFGFGGGMDWAELSEEELVMVCEELVDLECNDDPPPPPTLECSNDLGTCGISNDPVDSIACECVDGREPAFGGGNEWAELSGEDLLATCEMELNELCSELGGSTTSDGETEGTSTTGDGETEGTSTTGGGETEGASTTSGDLSTTGGMDGSGTGVDPSDSAGTTGGTNPGEGSGGQDSSGGSSGGADGGDGGGGCSVAAEGAPGGGALMLLGLLGLGWRRRRAG